MKEILFDPDIYKLEDEILNHLIGSPLFASRDAYFTKILGLFITRKYLTQKTIQKITGLSAGKVSEEVNNLVDMGLINKKEVSKKGKIIYYAENAGLIFLKWTKNIIERLIKWEKELNNINSELDYKEEVLKPLNGYSRLYNLNNLFLEMISSYKKSLNKLNEYVKKLE